MIAMSHIDDLDEFEAELAPALVIPGRGRLEDLLAELD